MRRRFDGYQLPTSKVKARRISGIDRGRWILPAPSDLFRNRPQELKKSPKVETLTADLGTAVLLVGWKSLLADEG